VCVRDGKYCGTVTTTSYGFSLGKQICLGFVQDLGDDNSPEVGPLSVSVKISVGDPNPNPNPNPKGYERFEGSESE